MERELATNAYSLWEVFSAFCRDVVGVDAEKVAAVILQPVGDRVRGLQARAERLELEPDVGTVEQIRERLEESWRVRMERGV